MERTTNGRTSSRYNRTPIPTRKRRSIHTPLCHESATSRLSLTSGDLDLQTPLCLLRVVFPFPRPCLSQPVASSYCRRNAPKTSEGMRHRIRLLDEASRCEAATITITRASLACRTSRRARLYFSPPFSFFFSLPD